MQISTIFLCLKKSDAFLLSRIVWRPCEVEYFWWNGWNWHLSTINIHRKAVKYGVSAFKIEHFKKKFFSLQQKDKDIYNLLNYACLRFLLIKDIQSGSKTEQLSWVHFGSHVLVYLPVQKHMGRHFMSYKWKPKPGQTGRALVSTIVKSINHWGTPSMRRILD